MTADVVLPDVPADIAGRRLFAVQGTGFTVTDVARHARPGGRELFSGDAAAVEEKFRRARGLLTADRLTEWLADWSITPEEFRQWCASGCASGSDPTWTALVCSGGLEAAAAELAAAAAAACELGSPPTSPAAFDPTGWVGRLAARVSTPEAVRATTAAHRLAWTRVRASGALAPSRAVAEELRHRTLHDGLELEVAARQAAVRIFVIDGALEDIRPPFLRARLAGAVAGEVVGPVEAGATWSVLRLEARAEPQEDHPATRERALAALRADALERAVLRHVSA